MEKIPKDIYKQTVRQFHRVPALKALLSSRERRYAKEFRERMDNYEYYIPYKSCSDIELDVRVDCSPSRSGPQERLTIEFRTEYEEQVLKLAGELADLEQILDCAIDMAVRDAKDLLKRKVYRRSLEQHLYMKIAVEELEINKATLRKYRDKAVYNAAEMLGYID